MIATKSITEWIEEIRLGYIVWVENNNLHVLIECLLYSHPNIKVSVQINYKINKTEIKLSV